MADSDTYIALANSMAQTAASYGQAANLNKKNQKFVEKQNALNRDLYREGIANTWEMWRATNQYNSPANQRKLLEEAGYNPASLSGMNGAANANQSSFQAPPNMNAPQYQGADLASVGSTFQNMLTLAQSRKVKADAVLSETDAITKAEKNKKELEKLGSEAKSADIDARVKDITEPAKVQQEQALAEKMSADANIQQLTLERDRLKYQLEKIYSPQVAAKELEKLEAEIPNIKSVTELNKVLQNYYPRMADAASQQALASYLQAQVAQGHLNLEADLQPYQIENLKQQNKNLYWDGKLSWKQYKALDYDLTNNKKLGTVKTILDILGGAANIVR